MPAVIATIPDSAADGQDVMLLKFSFPADVTAGQISGASLFIGVGCEDQGILAWVHPLISEWQSPPSWSWIASGTAYDEQELSAFESEECGGNVV